MTIEALTKLSDRPMILSPSGKHTWATNGTTLARIKQPLVESQKDHSELVDLENLFSEVESLPPISTHDYDLDFINSVKIRNQCKVCRGDYDTPVVCQQCNGTGTDECSECGHEIECPNCDGMGNADFCPTCDRGWDKNVPAFEFYTNGKKTLLKPQTIEPVVEALGKIRLRFCALNENHETPVYFTWDGGDGLIATCRY